MPDGASPPGSGLVHATRALLGRDPGGAEARARPADPLVMLAGLPEFGAQLARLAAGLPTRHVTLAPAALADTWDWARAGGLLSEDAAALPASPGALLPGLLHLPPVAARLAALPEAQQAALRRAAAAPGRTAGHLLTRPAEPEDHARLAGLLFGPGAMAAAGAEAPPVPLLLLLRHALGGERFRQAILRPLTEGGPLPGEGLPGPALIACAAWLARRLGTEPCPSAPPFHGALLAALLRLPAVAEMLAGLWPGERAAVTAALPDIASGLHQLQAPVLPDDAAHAWIAVLGRPLQGEPPPATGTRWALLRGLLGGVEFRSEVLHRLVEEAGPPHAGLTAGQRRMAAAWLRDRLALHPPAPEEGPPGGVALLRRLLALPVVAEELGRRHGFLWTDAEEALARQDEAEAAGLSGAIDYVTGDRITGWARRGDGGPTEVEVLCNGRLLGTARADKPRPAGEEGARGFRLIWDGRRVLAGGGTAHFRLREPGTGRPIGAAFTLDPMLAEARPALQAVTVQLAEARATLQRLEQMLPQLESFASWPPEFYDQFRRQHAVSPPPGPDDDGLLIDIVVDGSAGTVRGLRRTLDSLAAQGRARWTATVLAPPTALPLAGQAAARDPRIRAWPVEGDAGEAERAAVAAGQGGLVLLLPAGTLLDPAALAWFAHAAGAAPDAAGFLADEDEAVEPFRGLASYRAPVLRGALDEWSLAFADPGGRLVCARRPALATAWAAMGTADSHWALWAALRRQGPVGHIPRRLASVLRAEQPAPAASVAPQPSLLRHPWLLDDPARWVAPPTRITAIVPTRDGGPLLREALASLAAKAANPALLDALVIDNGSTAPETLAILEAGEAAGRFRVLRLPEPFNWSRLNNLAARETQGADGGEILLFLNDDTRMLTAGWDRILRRLLAEPEVGAVGARLLYEDRTIQHAGVLCGLERLVGHEGVGEPAEAPGPLGRWQTLRQAGAVTGAFLGCRREAFATSGGFDEQALPVSFNDVDFCLRLRAAGLAVLYEPRISLLHYESKSRGHDDADPVKQERAEAEQSRLIDRWGEALLLDPGWNPHWSRWTRPFAALREPSPEEIARHLAASCAANPWSLRDACAD